MAAKTLCANDLLSTLKLDHLLHQINKQPLWKRRRLLNANSKSSPYPRFLYKYRPLSVDDSNKMDSEQVNRLREYIVESKLWLSSPASFNDPFDMRGRHVFNGTPQAKRNHLISRLGRFRPELTKAQKELLVSNFLANGTIPELLDSSQDQQRHKIGICSFAGNAKNILMWSHYGSNHTGVCFQFQPMLDVFIFSHAHDVEYSNEYPVMNYLEKDYQDAILPTLFRKAIDWKYENERRIIQPDSANCYLSFKPAALTALVLGCEIKAIAEDAIKSLLIERQQIGYPPVRVFRAVRSDTQYRLRLLRQRDWPNSH